MNSKSSNHFKDIPCKNNISKIQRGKVILKKEY